MARLADDIFTVGFQPAHLSDFVDIDETGEVGNSIRNMRNLLSQDMSDEDLLRVMEENPPLAKFIHAAKSPNIKITSDIKIAANTFCRFVDAHPSDYELGKVLTKDKDASTVLDSTFTERLFHAAVINADEVYEYSQRLIEAGHRYEQSDVGIQAPLFDATFVEFKMTGNNLFSRGGVLIEIMNKDDVFKELSEYLEENSGIKQTMIDSKWLLRFSVVAQKRKGDKILGPLMHSYVPVSKDGTFYLSPDNPKWTIASVVAAGYFRNGKRLGFDECVNLERVCSELYITAYLTVSFTHCKNVKIVENDPNEDNKKLADRRLKKTGKAFVKFKTLEIPKMREVLEALREQGSSSNTKRLHIVRGHFKTYTKERPLLGKIVGQYYWGSQIRGVLKEGAVSKDYAVGPIPAPTRGIEKPAP